MDRLHPIVFQWQATLSKDDQHTKHTAPNEVSLSPLRVDKETVVNLVAYAVPQFLEIFKDCEDAVTWRKLLKKFEEMRTRLKIDNYVMIYEDDRLIVSALVNALFSPEERNKFNEEFNLLNTQEQQNFLQELAKPGGIGEQLAEELFPEDIEAQQAQIDTFHQLEEDAKREAVKRAQFLMGFFLAWIHDILAVMVHGEKMTSLVPKALTGDKDAFLKAIHIDKALIMLHPRFVEIHRQAIHEGDKPLLDKISYHLASPVTKGRVQLTGVFIAFSMLQSLQWLDDLKHREILDICDAAGLDRWQNRIEDENAITKALIKYRRYQKTGVVSMH